MTADWLLLVPAFGVVGAMIYYLLKDVKVYHLEKPDDYSDFIEWDYMDEGNRERYREFKRKLEKLDELR